MAESDRQEKMQFMIRESFSSGSYSKREDESEVTSTLTNQQENLLESFVKLAGMMLQARQVNLHLYDPESRQLKAFRNYHSATNGPLRQSGPDRSRETRPLSIPRRRGDLVAQSFQLSVDAPNGDLFDQLLANCVHNQGNSLAYPIVIEDQPFAFFKAEEREDGQLYSEKEQTMLELLANQLLFGLRTAQPAATTSINSLQLILPDENYLQAHLPGELERARRHSFNLSLMSLSPNISLTSLLPSHLEAEIGQSYLQEIVQHLARTLRRNLRSFDLICQNENNEFSIILPHTNEIEGYYVAKKLINQLDEDMSLSPNTRKAISLSVGIATYPIMANNAPVLTKQSRQALAQARKAKNSRHAIYIWGASRHFDLSKLEAVKDEAVARAMLRGFNYIGLAAETTTILPHAIPWEISRQYLCLAVQERQAVLTVAMADPSDSGLIALLARVTGRSIVPMVAERAEIQAALDYIARKRQPS